VRRGEWARKKESEGKRARKGTGEGEEAPGVRVGGERETGAGQCNRQGFCRGTPW